MTALVRSTRAELLRMRKWPAVWILVGAWLALNGTFGYLFDYIAYRSGDGSFSTGGVARSQLLAGLLPEAVPQVLLQGMPLFGGALMMVLGAVLAGTGFGVGTWKTAFTQGPSRVATVVGSLLALLVWVVGIVLATLVSDFGFGLGVAAAEGQAVVWPTLAATAQGVGAGVMVFGVWAMAGYLLGVVARGPAVSVGLGLVWLLVVENLLRGVGNLLPAVETATHVLPGTAVGSLVGAVVNSPGGTSSGDNTPGVLTVLSGTDATVTVAAYLVVLPLLAIVLMRQRDLS